MRYQSQTTSVALVLATLGLGFLSACAPEEDADTRFEDINSDTNSEFQSPSQFPLQEARPLGVEWAANSDEDGAFLGEGDLALIEAAYGELTKEEWEEVYATVDAMTADQFTTWLDALADYVESETDSLNIGYCSGYYGSRFDFGTFAYSTSSSYRNLWNTNCFFWSWSQCHADPIVSFWMGPDYRGDKSKLKAYASNSVARWYLNIEGGYAGEVWRNGSYYNAYACWPVEGIAFIGYAQLKQVY